MKRLQRPVLTLGCKGFTLVELLVALIITSIVLTAVATLAYAMGVANAATDDTSRKQSQVRYATLRISELIRHCKLICGTPGNDLVIWADDNGDGDGNGRDNGKINPAELVYIELKTNKISLLEFSARWSSRKWFKNRSFTINEIRTGIAKFVLSVRCDENRTDIIPECSNARALLDVPAPQSRFASIRFDLEENNITRSYQINASLGAWAGHLLDSSGEIVNRDDD